MPEEGENILKQSPGDKSLKAPFIVYADLECLLKKEQSCQNNSQNFYTAYFYVCHICKEKFCYDKYKKSEDALYHEVRDHCHYTGKLRGAAHSICSSRYKIPKKIPIVFNNGSTYDYHFTIKKLAEDSKGQFECLGENKEKYITFLVPSKKDGNSKKTTCKLKFIDSHRFLQSKLSDLVDNLSGIYNNKCKKMHGKKTNQNRI